MNNENNRQQNRAEQNTTERMFMLNGMRVKISSDNPALPADDEYFLGKGAGLHSLLSNFRELEPVSASLAPDMVFSVLNTAASMLKLQRNGHEYTVSGPVSRLEGAVSDKRSTVFGNMGLFSKVLVRELEEQGVFSFHSTSFVNPADGRLYLVLGGSGAGKSTVLLKALLEGMEIFGTELTHLVFRDGKPVFLKGSLWQNCRMGNLVEDFPPLLTRFGISRLPEGNPWHQYRSINLGNWQHADDELINPEVVILFPRIESERSVPERYQLKREKAAYSVYQNLADKVSPPSYLYGGWFVPSVDTPDAQVRRMKTAIRFLQEADIAAVWKVLTGPGECLDGIGIAI